MILDNLILYYNIILWVIYLLGCSTRFSEKNQTFLAFLIIGSISFLMALRGPETTVDTGNYYVWFLQCLNYHSIFDLFTGLKLGDEPILMSLFWIASQLGDFSLALWLVSILSLLLIYCVCIRIDNYFGTHISVIILLTYLISFYIPGQQYQVMRSGLAIGFAFNGIMAIFDRKVIKAICFCILGILTHFTILIPTLVAIISFKFEWKLKYYVAIYVAAIIIGYLGYGFDSMSGIFLTDVAKLQSYLGGDDSDRYVLGFRLSFVIFNSLFLFIYLRNLYNLNSLYNYLLRCYILLSVILFLSFNIPFFDRIGAFSWNLMPFLLIIGIIETYRKRLIHYTEMAFSFMFIVNMGIALISR